MSLDSNENTDFQQTIKVQPPDSDENNDVIILDDDDFIQTTFNLLDKLPKPTNKFGGEEIQSQSTNSNRNQSIMIDLATEFDLNELFEMHDNTHNINANTQHKIKNEFDFKVRSIIKFVCLKCGILVFFSF